MLDEAEEVARLGLQDSKKAVTRVECQRLLARVHALRGHADEAEAALLAGREDAEACGMYLLEVLIGKDLEKYVLAGTGREAEANALIEAAATRMSKPVSEFEALPPVW